MNNMMNIDPYTTALPHVTQCDKKQTLTVLISLPRLLSVT